MLEFLTTDFLIKLNLKVEGPGKTYSDPAACTASAGYYGDNKLMVASVFYSICKGHYFVDGNKRTATMVLYILCDKLKLQLPDDDVLFDKILEVASSKNLSVREVADILFD